MKDFTTLEYITPIIEEIKAAYTPEYSPAVLSALDCIVILNKKRSRNSLAIRTPDKGGFYYSSPATRKVYKALAEYAASAETEPGELDRWTWKEHTRIQEAIRAALIKEYRNPWKTTHTPRFIYSPKEYAATAQDTKIFIYDAYYSKLDTLQNE